jgi:hypothetical protein
MVQMQLYSWVTVEIREKGYSLVKAGFQMRIMASMEIGQDINC